MAESISNGLHMWNGSQTSWAIRVTNPVKCNVMFVRQDDMSFLSAFKILYELWWWFVRSSNVVFKRNGILITGKMKFPETDCVCTTLYVRWYVETKWHFIFYRKCAWNDDAKRGKKKSISTRCAAPMGHAAMHHCTVCVCERP